VQQAVAGEVEGVDLDLDLLPGMHEADVALSALPPPMKPKKRGDYLVFGKQEQSL
jgi:hypothetical protein